MKKIVLEELPNDKISIDLIDPKNTLIIVKKKDKIHGFIAVDEKELSYNRPSYYISTGTKILGGVPIMYPSVKDLIYSLYKEFSFIIEE